MRVAVVNWCARRAGGAESYLARVLGPLAEAGCELALWTEAEGPAGREAIPDPPGGASWCAGRDGLEAALAGLARWRPDALYVQGLLDPAVEARLVAAHPAVLFAHNYYGTCASGDKTFRLPRRRPCGRRFGAACLALYYPRRCGGLDPRSMAATYRRQAARRALLGRYRLVVTASEHMRREMVRHGVEPGRARRVGLFVDAPEETPRARAAGPEARLLCAGRLDRLKGLDVLLAALPAVADSLGRPVRLEVVGDGPDRPRLEGLAAALGGRRGDLAVSFRGWLAEGEKEARFAEADLAVIPSVWPEPFGLVGLEAARHGVPAAAFRVGGIADWLSDGRNGHLAPGDPPRPEGLAAAIARCLAEEAHHADLAAGARAAAQQWTAGAHLASLLPALGEAARERP